MNYFRPLVLITLLPLLFCGGQKSVVIKDKNTKAALRDMKELSAPTREITKHMLAYIQEVARGGDPNTVRKKWIIMIASVERAILVANQVQPYNGDNRYKEAVLRFLNTMYTILRSDYGRIVDMEKIAEKSYDVMEAILLAKQKANEKLKEAAQNLTVAEIAFARDYNITLNSGPDEVGRKLKKAGEVLNYFNAVYLIGFRSHKQEYYLLQALQREDISALEQNRMTLQEYAGQGMRELTKIPAYDADRSLLVACKANLTFFQEEAEKKFPILIEFLLKKEQFEGVKRAFALKKQNERSHEDIETYNRYVREMNLLVKRYNRINQDLNKRRQMLVAEWNRSGRRFLARHVPQ